MEDTGPPESSVNPTHSPEPAASDGSYIEIIHHPHSGISEPTIVRLDADGPQPAAPDAAAIEDIQRPWQPFRTRADFQYTAPAVAGGLSEELVDIQLKGIEQDWSVAGQCSQTIILRKWPNLWLPPGNMFSPCVNPLTSL